MSAQEFLLEASQTLKLNAERGTTLRVRSGDIWLTQHNDPRDYTLQSGHAMSLEDGGAAVIMAFQPSLLEVYRQDPVAVRLAIEEHAHSARREAIRAFFAWLFR